MSAEGKAGRHWLTSERKEMGDGLPPFGPECFVFRFAAHNIILPVNGYGWGNWDCHRLRVARAKGSTG